MLFASFISFVAAFAAFWYFDQSVVAFVTAWILVGLMWIGLLISEK